MEKEVNLTIYDPADRDGIGQVPMKVGDVILVTTESDLKMLFDRLGELNVKFHRKESLLDRLGVK